MEHLTASDVDRFLHGELERAQIEEIGAHVRTCERCAQRIASSRAFGKASESLWNSFEEPKAAPRRTPWWMLAAAAAVVAALFVAFLFRPGRRVIPTAEGPSAPRYARPEWNEAMTRARATNALEMPSILSTLHSSDQTSTSPGESFLRGAAGAGSDAAEPVAPVGVVVESTTPTFRWNAAPDTWVEVTVLTDDRSSSLISRTLRGTEWTPTEPLERGRSYSWQLRVGNSTSATARFAIASDKAAEEIAAARATGDRLLLAVVLAQHGVLDEADKLLATLDDPLAAKLRRSLR